MLRQPHLTIKSILKILPDQTHRGSRNGVPRTPCGAQGALEPPQIRPWQKFFLVRVWIVQLLVLKIRA